jgi:hypothetical protein
MANGKLGHEYHLGLQQDICAKKMRNPITEGIYHIVWQHLL